MGLDQSLGKGMIRCWLNSARENNCARCLYYSGGIRLSSFVKQFLRSTTLCSPPADRLVSPRANLVLSAVTHYERDEAVAARTKTAPRRIRHARTPGSCPISAISAELPALATSEG